MKGINVKRKTKRLVNWRMLLTCVLVGALLTNLSVLSGCSTEPQQPSAPPTVETTEDPMADRVITDAAGRELTVPGVGALKHIYYTGASAEIICITLAPDLAGGTTYDTLSPADYELLPAGMKNLQYLGTTSGQKQLNLEAIMAQDIQLIISMPFGAPGERDISEADDIQAQTGIPVIILDGSFEEISNNYRFLGGLFGKEAAAAKLADYCDTKIKDVTSAVATVPASERISLYYAEGSEGLQTEPDTSSHGLIFKLAGANNVAAVEEKQGMGMSDVSLEQVMAWDPEVIIVWSYEVRGGAENVIRSDSAWSSIQAVRDGRVYTMPNTPFSWCDRPPSVNRILGLQWIANMLYSDAYNVDMVDATKEFYSMFYHVNITDTQAKELLGNSYPVYQK